jgi:chromosome segregation ATPase
MPPKRSKKSDSSSQPAPEPQKAVRTSGRKRRASDASSVQSEQPASSHGPVLSTPAKKRKTRKVTAASEEPETIIEEEVTASEAPQAVVYPTLEPVSELEAATIAAAAEVETDEVTHAQSRHVHFGSDDISEKTTATHKTPHTKMAIKRRITESPSKSVATSPKRYRTITHRTSLPAMLSEEHQEPIHVVQEHRFVSLREALDERIKRFSRRSQAGELSVELDDLNTSTHSQKELEKLRKETAEKEKRINELVLELESQRQLGIDANYDSKVEQDRLHAVELELEVLRKQILINRARGHLDDHPDENMMVIDSQQERETSYPRLPRELRTPDTPPATSKRSTLSTGLAPSGGELLLATPGHRQWEDERRRFQDSILALSREANEATTALQILSIELKSLGFSADDEVNDLSVVQSIRDSFEHIRERLERVLPGTIPEGATNAEILEILMANVKEFADLLRIRDKENQEQVGLSIDLRIQIDKLLDHLATSEIRIQTLKQRWRELDEGSERKERELEDLEAEIETAEEENKALETALKERNRAVKALEQDNANLQQSVQKLTTSLQGYRDEEVRLQNIITKLEETHASVIVKMNTERDATLLDMQARLDAEAALRDQVEKEADGRHALITGLEARILAVETERDALHIEFQKAQADLTAERMVREQVETDAAQKDTDVADLEARVSALETELDTLTAELDELRTLNEAERRQREAAETELDDRNVEIEDLNKKLADRGTEANGLRQKLFEVQQQNTIKIQDLENRAADRDAQYQVDIAAEVERREDAEEVTRVRDAMVLELQASLAETEKNMAALLVLRDARIVELETEVVEQGTTIARLQDDLRDLNSRISLQTTEDQSRREVLEASIVSLQTTILGYENTIQTMERESIQTTDLHNSEMEDRNSAIASLNHNVVVLQGQVADLEREKAGLEERVNDEAEAMLQLSAEKEDEIDTLKQLIRDKQSKILIVEEKAVEADRRWQEVLDARDEEIRRMRAEAEMTTTTYAEVTMQRDSLKQQFQAYIRRSAGVIDNLQAALERARATAEKEGDALKNEADGLLEELEGLDEVTELVSKKKVVTHSASASHSGAGASKKSAAKGKKKRIYDSGYGVASDEGEGEMIAN